MSCFPRYSHFLEYLDKPTRRIDCIVIPEIAVGKKQVPAHFSRQSSSDLFHLGLDQRMSCLPHDGIAAMGTDIIIHRLGTLDLGNESGSRFSAEDIARKDDHELVSPENITLFVYYSYPVRISIKGDACVRFLRPDRINQNTEIFRYRRIRMMIGKCSVSL